MTAQRTVAWQRVGTDHGHSMARLEARADGWWSAGQEVVLSPEGPIGCRFEISLGEDWLPTSILVQALSADGAPSLELARDVGGHWYRSGAEVPELEGCIDVDVAATPLTNTYPIRRYADLAIGTSRTSPVAWVEVPSLRVERVDQTYTRVADRAWDYGDPKHGTFRITVDAHGLVIDYEGFAKRIPG